MANWPQNIHMTGHEINNIYIGHKLTENIIFFIKLATALTMIGYCLIVVGHRFTVKSRKIRHCVKGALKEVHRENVAPAKIYLGVFK